MAPVSALRSQSLPLELKGDTTDTPLPIGRADDTSVDRYKPASAAQPTQLCNSMDTRLVCGPARLLGVSLGKIDSRNGRAIRSRRQFHWSLWARWQVLFGPLTANVRM